MRLSKMALFVLCGFLMLAAPAAAQTVQNPQNGAVGVQGLLNGAPPTQPATIVIPTNGQTFTNIPITVSGTCPNGLLIEIFDNNVFVGSVYCTNGSFSLQIDLFAGRNDLIARDYDALNQAGPDSNTVTVLFNSATTVGVGPTLTSIYARRGADPGSTLTWPITLSGGTGPYAISIDWGDNSPTDLISRQSPGDFTIQHTYRQSGIYKITIKAVDANGAAAFLQLTAVSNGPIQQGTQNKGNTTCKTNKIVQWWPMIALLALAVLAFWLGKKHQLELIRNRLRHGERPI